VQDAIEPFQPMSGGDWANSDWYAAATSERLEVSSHRDSAAVAGLAGARNATNPTIRAVNMNLGTPERLVTVPADITS
jgi:hypothetical protein